MSPTEKKTDGLEQFNINGKKWFITRDARGHIFDISVELTREDYLHLQGKLFDPNSTFENTSAVNLFRNGLAKARFEAQLDLNEQQFTSKNPVKTTPMMAFLNTLKDTFEDPLMQLDASVNGLFTDPNQKIDALTHALQAYQLRLSELKKHINHQKKPNDLSDDQYAFILEDYNQLFSTLLAKTAEFNDQLHQLNHQTPKPTMTDVTLLLSAQDRDTQGKIQSLGGFLASQTHALCETAEKITSTINGSYFADLAQKNSITEAFTLTKSKIRLKNTSLYGAEFTDTFDAAQQDKTLPTHGLLSIMPYLEDKTSANVDKFICLITGEPLSSRTLSTPRKNLSDRTRYTANRALVFTGLYIAPILEFGLFTLHFIPTTILILLRPAAPLLIDNITTALNDIHAQLSPVKAAKRLWHQQYQRVDTLGEPLKPNTPQYAHQALLNAYKQDLSDQSLYADFFHLYTPKNIAELFRVSQNNLTQRARAFFSRNPATPPTSLDAMTKISPQNRSPESIYDAYEQTYDVMKAWLTARSKQDHEAHYLKKTAARPFFPGPHYQRINAINSPARVLCEVMYILNENTINYLADTRPGPSTLFFIISTGTFGLQLLPAATLAGLHGAPSALNMIPLAISKYFMGKAGAMAPTQGVIAGVMEWQLACMSTMLMQEAVDKQGVMLEQIATNPEEILAALVAFVGLGYAVGFIPKIPPIPSSNPLLAQANIYGTFVNFLSGEAATARLGIMPLTALEYGFLGFKCKLLVESMIADGKHTFNVSEFDILLHACKDQGILDIKDSHQRKTAILAIFSTLDQQFWNTDATNAFVHAVNETVQKKQTIQSLKAHAEEKVKKHLHAAELAVKSAQAQFKEKTKSNSFMKLQKAIQMLGDPETPLTFPSEKRNEAIQFYNHLDRLFDTYNEEVRQGNYPDHQEIPKEDFLHVFRNKYCASGSNNWARMLSFYPGYPIRYAWREYQLGHIIPFKPTPYVMTKIEASKEKDLVLRGQWAAMAKGASYAAANLINKSLKFIIGIVPALLIICIGGLTNAANAWTTNTSETPVKNKINIKTRLQQLGRGLDRYINIANLLPTSAYRRRVVAAAHTASDVSDIQRASARVECRLNANNKHRPLVSGPHKIITHKPNKHAIKSNSSTENMEKRSHPKKPHHTENHSFFKKAPLNKTQDNAITPKIRH